MKLTPAFFLQPTPIIAQALLGCFLIHEIPMGRIGGKIVETEAYLKDDSACHASCGKTERNAVMFGPPGQAYVYLTYGIYYCFNVVTQKEGVGEAVLIRALEPLEGIHLMQERRRTIDIKQLCNGPAKMTIALGITKKHNGISLLNSPLKLMPRILPVFPFQIHTTARIGIKKAVHLPLRFYLKGNEFISRK